MLPRGPEPHANDRLSFPEARQLPEWPAKYFCALCVRKCGQTVNNRGVGWPKGGFLQATAETAARVNMTEPKRKVTVALKRIAPKMSLKDNISLI